MQGANSNLITIFEQNLLFTNNLILKKMKKFNQNFAKGTKSNSNGNVCKPITEVHSGAKKYFKIALGLFLFAALFIPFVGKAIGLKMSALYMFSNDGKVSGRTGGDVKMRNGRSRAMAFPALVRNIYTSTARGFFSTFSSSWRTLNDAERTTWLNFSYSTTDRFARPITIRGKSAYVGINTNLSNVGGTPIALAPTGATPPSSTIITELATDVSLTQMNIVYAVNATGGKTLVYATTSLSPSINRPSQSAYRLIGVVNTSAASPADIWAAYVAKFGVPAVGARVFLQLRSIDVSTGLASAITQVDGIVAA